MSLPPAPSPPPPPAPSRLNENISYVLNENLSYVLNECFQDCVLYCDLHKILCKFVYLGHCVFGLRCKDELSINECTSLNVHNSLK